MLEKAWLPLIGIFFAAAAAGFVYGAKERTDQSAIDEIIVEHISLDDKSPSLRLIYTCSPRRPIFFYDLETQQISQNLIETEGYRKLQAMIDGLDTKSVGYILGTGATALGAKSAWSDFKEGKASAKGIATVVGGVVVGFPLGYWIATDIYDVNCEANSVFQRLSDAKAWPRIRNIVFVRMFESTARNRCVPDDSYDKFLESSLGRYPEDILSLSNRIYHSGLGGEKDFMLADFRLLTKTIKACNKKTREQNHRIQDVFDSLDRSHGGEDMIMRDESPSPRKN